MVWLLSIVLILYITYVLSLWFGHYFFNKIFNRYSDKEDYIHTASHTKQKVEDDWFYENNNVQTISLQSHDGLRLQGYAVVGNLKTWVVLVHGYCGCFKDMIPSAKQFYDMGYSVLVVDLRAHGESEGSIIGFGALDHQDMMLWCNFLKQERKAESLILYDASMGATTCLLCANDEESLIELIIANGAFSTFAKQLKEVIKARFPFVPAIYVLFCLRMVLHRKTGYRLKEVDSMIQVKQSKVPILFLRGKHDTSLPISMMETLY